MMKRMTTALLLASALPAVAQNPSAPSAAGDKPAATQPAMPEGLLPLPVYTGTLLERSHLTGDWGGLRTDLAKKGIQFDIDWTQTVQSVTDGGKSTGTRYGGTLDYNLNIDLHRMGAVPGGLFRVRAESRYGEAVNDIAGALVPANTDGLMPLSDQLDGEVPFWITSLNYTQFLGSKLGVTFGKFDTLDSANEFAGGRGTSQFMNGNFVLPVQGVLSVPYSTLAAGIIVMPIENLMITSLVMNTHDASSTSGFNDIGEGQTWVTTVSYQYQLADLPGGVNGTAGYAWDGPFKRVNGGLVFERGLGLSAAKEDDTAFWALDAWQYLWLEEPAKAAIRNTDGRQDLQGVGVFVRFGSGDQDTNPIDWTATAGIAAKGLIPTRDRDTMGVAYAYTRLQESRLRDFLDVQSAARALEFYYDIAVTPAAHLTLDLQVLDPVAPGLDQAVVVGGRFSVKF